MKMARAALVGTLLLLLPSLLLAWGEKGHSISNEAATFGLPAEMPAFFHKAYPSLIYLGYDPDRWRGGGESLDAVNPPNHFLDYEYVAALELPRDRYKFIALMESSGTLRKFGITNTTAGFLPWRIAELTELLTIQWRLWRGSRPEERPQIEQNIIFLSGVLGHFVSDGANPHHASMHYNGWAFAENPNRYPTDCETHGRFETVFVTQTIVTADVVPKLAPPLLRSDPFTAALDHIRGSLSKIDEIYRLDRDRAFFRETRSAEGRAFVTDRLAVGASLLRDLWWSAYKNSERGPSRRR